MTTLSDLPRAGGSANPSKLDELADEDDFCRQCSARLPIDNMYGWRKFCSSRCRLRWHYEHSPEMFGGNAKMFGERICACCQKKFEAGAPSQKYCSHPCYWKAKRKVPDRPCAHCGVVFRPRDRLKKYCSLPCAWKAKKRVDTPHPEAGRQKRPWCERVGLK